jgi:hypothetical protein
MYIGYIIEAVMCSSICVAIRSIMALWASSYEAAGIRSFKNRWTANYMAPFIEGTI